MRVREKYNSSGCLDMTAYLALRNIERKEKLERQARKDKLNNITKQGKNNNTAVSKKG